MGARSDARSFTILFAITTQQLPNGKVGDPYESMIEVTGGKAPYIFDIPSGSLPPGLTLDATTGETLGTPESGGTWSFTVQVSDSMTPPQTATRSFTISTGPVAVAPGHEEGSGGGSCGLVGLEAILMLFVLGLRQRLR